MELLADLVAVSARVAATSSRREKVELLADYLDTLDGDALPVAVAYLIGETPQGSLGVGWATIGDVPVPAPSPSLTLAEVTNAFDALVEASGSGSSSARSDQVRRLLAAATEAEQEYLVGLIIGEVRHGALEGVMTEALARTGGVGSDEIRRALMFTGRLWEVAAGLGDPNSTLERLSRLQLFRPVKPMLAQTASDPGSARGQEPAVAVEWKLDGVRIQVHRQADRVEIYTRNLNPVTSRLAEVAELVRRFPLHSIVLDGEVLSFGDDGRPARFQETAGRFGTEELNERGLHPFFFDILHLDGDDLVDRPLAERRPLLEKVVGDHAVPHLRAELPEEVEAVLGDALAVGHEGVVVKDLDSTYQAGRRGAAWRKLKPVHTLDLVVLAAEWGHGRRQGWLSNLHLGALGEDGFVMVGKTFKGLTDELLRWQTDALQTIEVRRTGSTVFVRPELVVEVAVDGVQVSNRYPGGVALRFARVRGYRHDRDPGGIDTISVVRRMAGLE